MYTGGMARTIIDIDDDKLARAQRALRTTTKRDTVNAALELAAAVDVQRRTAALEELRDLLDRLDVNLIDQDERDDHAA
jgi:Arc/MetJ family transcription regulator